MIYVLSGLGADERVFKNIDWGNAEVTHIKWVDPKHCESINDYASLLLNQITHPKPILIGLSFGGMVAVEISKYIETEKIILIASAKNKFELPLYFRFGPSGAIPNAFFRKNNFLTNWFFSANGAEEKQLLQEILQDTDPAFFRWAIQKITKWDNTTAPENLTHIHGTADRILPFRNISKPVAIKAGGHLMTLTPSVEISRVINLIIRPDIYRD